jgi:hypothetical protein
MSEKCTEEMFLRDVADHKLTIIKDDGVYRHLRLSRPEDSCFRFDIVTYPGHLVISGDMGAGVFARVEDMFHFFRSETEESKLYINLGYWREKLQSCKDDSYKFTHAEYARVVRRHLEDMRDYVEDFDGLVEAAEADLFSDESGEETLRDCLAEFEWEGSNPFSDSWEWDFREYTYDYTWRCYAIVWAIKQYDKQTTK